MCVHFNFPFNKSTGLSHDTTKQGSVCHIRVNTVRLNIINMDSNVYDVIIVGAGIEGSATAYQVAKRGKSSLLLEQVSI